MFRYNTRITTLSKTALYYIMIILQTAKSTVREWASWLDKSLEYRIEYYRIQLKVISIRYEESNKNGSRSAWQNPVLSDCTAAKRNKLVLVLINSYERAK